MKDELTTTNNWRHLDACEDTDSCAKESYSLDLNGGASLYVERCAECHRYRTQRIHCSHETKEVRLKKYANGGTAAYEQCMTCGETFGTAIKQTPNLLVNGALKPAIERVKVNLELDSDVRAKLYDNRCQQLSRDRKQEHEAYMQSDEWKRIRNKVLERDRFLCQACLSSPATQVHHMTYKNIGQEFAWELYSVCKPCHERYHENDSEDDRQ